MANLGLSIDLPESWQTLYDLSEAQLTTMAARDETRVTELRDIRRRFRIRFGPEGNSGVLAAEPSTSAEVLVAAEPGPVSETTVDAHLDRFIDQENARGEIIGNIAYDNPPILGARSARAIYRIRPSTGPETFMIRTEVPVLPDWLVTIQIRLPGDGEPRVGDFDQILASLSFARSGPTGGPHVPNRDPILEARLPAQFGRQEMTVFAGDQKTLEFAGLFEDQPFFRTALRYSPELVQEPVRLRGGTSEPTQPVVLPIVFVGTRIDGASNPKWSIVIDQIRAGLDERKVGSRMVYLVRAAPPGEIRAVTIVDEVAIVIVTPSQELLEAALDLL